MTSDSSTSRGHADDIGPSDAPAPDGPQRLLLWLEGLPKVAVFLSVLVITVAILMTPGKAGAVLTLVLAGAAGYLVFATWPRHTARASRLARVLVVLALAVLGVGKLFL
ncbi:hypothetical protein LX16_0660 [Stackebrandtia albiflava]|uniref:Uncharacterized protein n=1 Tax=Stackebrandtia albiflava TaxID=406432 RepID=A0A562VAR6_9ACTN|nr:DUF6703 family protein [Stackebrandtia albiflava]TWJ14965.1 hypothetical protein LX16_0660 [Stackebrandtia albiflava]